MADEITDTRSPREMRTELERARENSARLLDALAHKLGAHRAIQGASAGVHRAAHYVQAHSMKDVTAGVAQAVRRRPASSVALAVVAGYLLGTMLRRR